MTKEVKRLVFLLCAIFIAAAFNTHLAIAVENEDGQYPTINKDSGSYAEKGSGDVLEDQLGDIIPTLVRKKIGKLKIDVSASMIGGYDSNVNLNRYDEDGSVFMQETFGIYGTYPISDVFTLRTGYDFTSIKYFKFSDPDLIDNILSVGLDTKFSDMFTWSIDYMADFVGFPHDQQSEYTMNYLSTGLRQDINDWLYHKIIYEFSYRHYPKWRTLNNYGWINLGGRNDMRNAVMHQIGVYLGDKTFLKTENKLYTNNSNERFMDFYDYRAFKTKATLTQLITDKFYGSANFAYQYKAYNQRSVSDREHDQRDHLFMYGLSLYYDIIPSVSWGTSFDFRRNRSNENDQKYENYIVSSGVYCTF